MMLLSQSTQKLALVALVMVLFICTFAMAKVDTGAAPGSFEANKAKLAAAKGESTAPKPPPPPPPPPPPHGKGAAPSTAGSEAAPAPAKKKNFIQKGIDSVKGLFSKKKAPKRRLIR